MLIGSQGAIVDYIRSVKATAMYIVSNGKQIYQFKNTVACVAGVQRGGMRGI